MRWYLLLALLACNRREGPSPLPKRDGGAAAATAASEVDAAVVKSAPVASKIVVGDHASCVLMSDATLRCWGNNSDGQLGNGSTTDSPVPVATKLRGVKDVVLGTSHACALLDDESVTCWGGIQFGNSEKLAVPHAAPGVSKAKRIFAVGGASCATTEPGPLVCWGDVDVAGHVRTSGGAAEHRMPTPSRGLDRVTALAVDGALHEDGSVSFWGKDGVPVKTTLAGVTEIAADGDRICGLRADGSVACAGPTRCAAAVKPASKPAAKPAVKKKKGKRAPPVKAAPPPPTVAIEVLPLPAAKHLAFDAGPCVVTTTGKLQCLSESDPCTADAPWSGLASVESVAGFCARARAGAVRCWPPDRRTRVVRAVLGVESALELAASSSHACAIRGDRSVACWGSNKHGALGRGKAADEFVSEAGAIAQ